MKSNRQDSFVIEGPSILKGKVVLSGSKNAAFPVIAASILTKKNTIFDNVPKITDVFLFIKILEKMGAKILWLGPNKLSINCKNINPEKIDYDLVSKLRGSIVLIGPLLARFKKISITEPGGCFIGARPIDTHINAFKDLGVKVEKETYYNGAGYAKGYKYVFSFQEKDLKSDVMLEEFSVTASENIILFAAGLNQKVKVWGVALEPHVIELCKLLVSMGAKINGVNSHELIIQGSRNLKAVNHTIEPDYLEAGTFVVASALTKSDISIYPFPYDSLKPALVVLKKMGFSWNFNKSSLTFKLNKASSIYATEIKTSPHPGFPSDLQSSFGVLATQAQGTTLLFERLYEGRLRYLNELKKLGASIIIADTHRAFITGPTQLVGGEIESFDIRAGATMILAALVAKGRSLIRNASQIDRGYENFDKKLRLLGANIKRIST